jgi:hypothetical protein
MKISTTFKIPFPGKEKIRRFLLYGAVGVTGLLLVLFLLRNFFFHLYLESRIRSAEIAYHAEIEIGESGFSGISTLHISGLMLKPEHGDTLLKIGNVETVLNPWRLLFRKVVLHDLRMKDVWLNIVKKGDSSNYRFLLESRSRKALQDTSENFTYADRMDRISGLLFSLVPEAMNILNFLLSDKVNGHLTNFFIQEVNVQKHAFQSPVTVWEGINKSSWIIKGNLFPSERIAGFTVIPHDPQNNILPFLNFRWGADVRFDTVSFSFAEKQEDDQTKIHGFARIHGLQVNHEKISANPVFFNKLGIVYRINVGEDYYELDSTSLITFNQLDINPYFRYQPKPAKNVVLRIHKPEFPAQDLFSSLPPGLFTALEGMKVKGDLSWSLDFSVDLAQPDSLFFDTELKRRKFSVISYGNSDLLKMNDPFPYTAYEKGVPVTTFIVGPENPDFRPIEKISPFLKLAVLGSEDAGFYQHRGFIAESFRESIITNIKERRFARGGSTISMQLVKNVFLNRNKTVARKLEEALIVWLIENQGLCTKDRMFEVYLNIIEWGPGIYGANEAARFYFNKDASKLTLAESIFLASIIPRPKWFKYSFDENGHLKQFAVDFQKLLSEKMLRKEQITQKEYDKFVPDVELKGQVKMLLKKTEPVPMDSTYENDYGL